jgi:histidyl-tRNA synthetase
MLFEQTGHRASYLAHVRESLASAIPGILAPVAELGVIVEVLEQLGVEPRIDALLARNFEYYSGVVFKIFVDGERLITGGRYDGLLELVAGTPTPASGFGLYVRSTASLLEAPSMVADDRCAVMSTTDPGPPVLAALYALAAELRSNGWRVDTVDGGPDASASIIVSPDAPSFRVSRNGETRSFEQPGDVLKFLGGTR